MIQTHSHVMKLHLLPKKLTQFSLVLNHDICDTAFEIDRLFYLFDEEQKPELWLRLKSEKKSNLTDFQPDINGYIPLS